MRALIDTLEQSGHLTFEQATSYRHDFSGLGEDDSQKECARSYSAASAGPRSLTWRSAVRLD